MAPSSSKVPPISGRRALVFAILIYFVVTRFVPFGRTMLYPLTLLATWVHEMGHGLTAVLLGGRFLSLDVYANASGLAHTSTPHAWQSGLTAAGGLLAPPIVGAVLLGTSRGPRRASGLLIALCVAILVSLVVWVRSLAGFIALPIVAALILGAIRWGTPERRMIFSQLLGVTLAIDTVSGSGYLFTSEALVEGTPRKSDIVMVADAFGSHYLVWGVLLAGLSFALLTLGLWLAWRPASARVVR